MPYLWGYARKSPEGVGSKTCPCPSVEQQEAMIEQAIREFLSNRGQYVGTNTQDGELSAVEVPWRQRAGLQTVLRGMNRGDTLVVCDLTRLERGGAGPILDLTRNYMTPRGLHLYSITEQIDYRVEAEGQLSADRWRQRRDQNLTELRVAIAGYAAAEETIWKSQATSRGLQYRKGLGLRHTGGLPLGYVWQETGDKTKLGKPEYQAVPLSGRCRIVVEIWFRHQQGEPFRLIGMDLDHREIPCYCWANRRGSWTLNKTTWQKTVTDTLYWDLDGRRTVKGVAAYSTREPRKTWERVRRAWKCVERARMGQLDKLAGTDEKHYGGILIPQPGFLPGPISCPDGSS